MEYILGIDAGTSSFKAVLFDTRGIEIASATYEYELNYLGAERIELDPEKYWEACKSVIKEILSKWHGNIQDIKALSIASQGETLIILDSKGNPLRPAIVWLDNRAVKEADEIKEVFGVKFTYEITGQPDIVPTWPAAKILWIKRNESVVYKKIHRILLLEDYLIYRFTNQFVSEGSLLSSTLMFDINYGQWWDDMLKYLGIPIDQLSEIKQSGQIVTELTDKAANECGLTKETLVVTGALDQAASTIGAGNIGFNHITETTGSVLAICANTSKPVFDPLHRIPCQYHALPDAYFLLPWCQTAGMVYKWFRNEFYNIDNYRNQEDMSKVFERMDNDAAQITPGSEGIIMLPHLAGAFTPESNPLARGVFFGLSLQTKRAHLARAILESVAFMLKRNVILLEELGIVIKEINSIGGGAKSRLWNQIKADVSQKTVTTVRTPETTSLGIAMMASVALKIYNNIEDAVLNMSHPGKRIEPEQTYQTVYEKAYRKYIQLYNAVEPLF